MTTTCTCKCLNCGSQTQRQPDGKHYCQTCKAVVKVQQSRCAGTRGVKHG